jgi:hypothetical protein
MKPQMSMKDEPSAAHEPGLVDAALEAIQHDAFAYFLRETSPENGLVADNSRADSVASIAAVGFGLAAYAVGVERGFITRTEAVERTLTTLRFFRGSVQSEQPDATGHRGFYYHFLELKTGVRTWQCELSMVDTALLIAGALVAMTYFDGAGEGEKEVRDLAAFLYERIDWRWAMNDRPIMSMGWKPGHGFIRYGWGGYSEAILLYVLGLGSPTHPLSPAGFAAWTLTYQWEDLYGCPFLFAAPLFVHQFSHAWIDFRGIQDAFMREKRSDYFENSRRATYVQQHYAMRNPQRCNGYGENCWGISAGDGPGWSRQGVEGAERDYWGYVARGVPYGPDDGTLAPWAVAASLPFAPEIVLPALRHMRDAYPGITKDDGALRSFNPTFSANDGTACGWVCPDLYGLEQGPVVLMVENYRSGLLWCLMRRCKPVVAGLRQAGFRGGWLRRAGR